MGPTSELTIVNLALSCTLLVRLAQQDFDITTFYPCNDCKIIS